MQFYDLAKCYPDSSDDDEAEEMKEESKPTPVQETTSSQSAAAPSTRFPPPPSFLSGLVTNKDSQTCVKRKRPPLPLSESPRKVSRNTSASVKPTGSQPRVVQQHIAFVPPQLRLRKPNISTEDLSSYGCRQDKTNEPKK